MQRYQLPAQKLPKPWTIYTKFVFPWGCRRSLRMAETWACVPPDLDQNFSSVRQAQSELIQSAAELGIIHSYQPNPETDA